MLKQRLDAAQQLASRLFETEKAIDEAISKMADLAGYMPVARNNAKIAAVVGQDAMSHAAQVLTTLIGARGEIVETHQLLAAARDQIGLRTTALGGGNFKPPLLQEGQGLSLVEKAA
ncbi:hypothetical protein MNBD_ALPHA04-1947 [hydrothermal vent metagenome]|uniref:Uncharacterized protein n=1 Tax=hydrothermal vent metagenome TaxID=652676 RepID=A0A3B0RUT4_9ZZZZ